jgi:hypothetical protein
MEVIIRRDTVSGHGWHDLIPKLFTDSASITCQHVTCSSVWSLGRWPGTELPTRSRQRASSFTILSWPHILCSWNSSLKPQICLPCHGQATGRRHLNAEARVRACVSPCRFCGGQSGSGTDFSPSSSAFPCQHLPRAPSWCIIQEWTIGSLWPQFRDVVSPHRHEQQQQPLNMLGLWHSGARFSFISWQLVSRLRN